MFQINDKEKLTVIQPEKIVKKRVVLQEGNSTGHAHAFYEPDKVELVNNTLTVKEKTELKHEEHSTIAFEPGQYFVVTQQEYVMGEIRQVLD